MLSPPCSTMAFSSGAALAAVRVVNTTKNPSRANFCAMAPPTPQRIPTGTVLSSSALPCASLVLRPSACHLEVAPTTTATCFLAPLIANSSFRWGRANVATPSIREERRPHNRGTRRALDNPEGRGYKECTRLVLRGGETRTPKTPIQNLALHAKEPAWTPLDRVR